MKTPSSSNEGRAWQDAGSGHVSLPLPDNLPAARVFDAVAEAIYTTDPEGRITYYNRAAEELWGVRPELGRSEFCGSWKLFYLDGTPMPHSECPMALALQQRRAIRGMMAIAERPDGTKVPFLAAPTPLFDAAGELIGAVNILVDLFAHHERDIAARRYAAIVEHSDDAIIAKDLKGVITAWNRGAERLFGYTAAEVIGRPITILIPPDRADEGPGILARIRAGERIGDYETTRQRKDGTPLEISLTVSPIKDDQGRVIGASKIARDITERRRAEEQRRLLLREMDHRAKNMLTLAGSLVKASARSTTTAKDLSAAVSARLEALGQAHSLVVNSVMHDDSREVVTTTLHALIETILAPYRDGANIEVSGVDVPVGRQVISGLALLLHEFATNAAKYGALSAAGGQIGISVIEQNQDIVLTWVERGGPPVEPPQKEGFGSVLIKSTIDAQLGGNASYDWNPDGLRISMIVPRQRLATS